MAEKRNTAYVMDGVLAFNELTSLPAGFFDAVDVSYDTDIDQIDKLKDVASAVKYKLPVLHSTVADMTARMDTMKERASTVRDCVERMSLMLPIDPATKEAVQRSKESVLKEIDSDIKKVEAERDKVCGELLFLSDIIRSFTHNASTEPGVPPNCPVCFNPGVDYAMVPCGHTLCSMCNSKMASQYYCAFCRGNITLRMKLFFG